MNYQGRAENFAGLAKGRRKAIIESLTPWGEGVVWESAREWAKANGGVMRAKNVSTACLTGMKAYGKYFRHYGEERVVLACTPVKYLNYSCE